MDIYLILAPSVCMWALPIPTAQLSVGLAFCALSKPWDACVCGICDQGLI